ncbi:MAG: TetR/AcrR family transcriptional regulator [Ruthenibacterium sp.]
MNTIVTSKEAILSKCRELATTKGLQAVNMRAVAKICNVSVGSVYNYFPSKADLIVATVQDVWQSIFHLERGCQQAAAFPEYVQQIFDNVQAGAAAYPDFFTAHSAGFAAAEKGKGRQMMASYFEHMEKGLLEALQNDAQINSAIFTEDFTRQNFAGFILTNLIALLMQHESTCTVLLEVIKRIIY